jgi:hypothetical protein
MVSRNELSFPLEGLLPYMFVRTLDLSRDHQASSPRLRGELEGGAKVGVRKF